MLVAAFLLIFQHPASALLGLVARANQVNARRSPDDAAALACALIDSAIQVPASGRPCKPNLLNPAKATVLVPDKAKPFCELSGHDPVGLLFKLNLVEHPQGNPYANGKRNG
ncbi:hypothetical protein [Ralstonia insidiosa]|jgi:hypothetical protein|nr:hypothetical protein [Ralstonia insidiosa]MBX3905094.1 hypothetical protein [Ralstonia insidiosa]